MARPQHPDDLAGQEAGQECDDQAGNGQAAAPVRVLCLSDRPEPIAEAAARHGVELHLADTVRGLVDSLMEHPCSGIILDMRKMMRASGHEKAILQEFVESFPLLHVNVLCCNGRLQLKAMGSLDVFLGETCPAFEPRSVRRNIRHTVHLPLFLAREDDPDFRQAEKSYTLDLSEGGVFLYSAGDWSHESWVRLRFLDLKDQSPIVAHVRWWRPWGVGLALCGLGVKFGRITPEQHATLCRRFLLRERFTPPDVEDIREALQELFGEASGEDAGEGEE